MRKVRGASWHAGTGVDGHAVCNMTASVTMRMWRSTSCASWRPDPRHGSEAARAVSRRLDTPAETGCRAASAPRRFAPAVRVGLPSNRSPQRGLQRPWANPRTCARGCRRGSRSYPQFRCTNSTPSCTQTLAVNRGLREPRRAHPTDNGLLVDTFADLGILHDTPIYLITGDMPGHTGSPPDGGPAINHIARVIAYGCGSAAVTTPRRGG